jgi:hypothetical protein
MQNQQKNISQIEEMTQMNYDSVIFDTDVCDWNRHTSTFSKRIFNKEKLVFIIEDTIGNIFGGFIHSKISNYTYEENGEWKGSKIDDSRTFLFSLVSKQRL